MKIYNYLFWLILVILWNYIFPNALPFLDVVVAVLLGIFKFFLDFYFVNKKR